MSDFFAGARPGRRVTHGAATFELPILYHRDDCFLAFFEADLDRVRAVMPSRRLHPVQLRPGGPAVIVVAAFNYLETSIGPYGEVAAVAPVVHGGRPLPLLPALLESWYPGMGSVVLHLPVTTRAARDAGRGEWGYTKFVADMRFTTTPEGLTCRVDEGGRHVLTLRVPRSGLVHADRRPMVLYSVLGEDLLRTRVPQRGLFRTALRPRGASLELGDHAMAASLRALGIDLRPLMTRYALERSAILPAGEVVEREARPLDGIGGEDREGQLVSECLPGAG